MSCCNPMHDCKKMLKTTQMIIYLCLLLGMTFFFSPIIISESTALESTKIIISSFLDYKSTLILKADMNPAIGAFTLSFRLPKRRSAHKMNLYPKLKMHANNPNLAESFYIENLSLNHDDQV